MPKPTKKAFTIPKPILYLGKLLQFFSPYLAMRFVFKLFMTPHKFKRPNREDKMYLEANKEKLFLPEFQKSIQIYKYGEAPKKILLVHGWAGRGTQLYKIAETFVEKGYMAISFDATAHGDSDGKTSAMTEFIPAILAINKQYGPFEFAIGHSLGGMALLNAVKQGFSVKRIALLGSGDSISDICHLFVKKLELKPKVAHLLKVNMDNLLGYDVEILSANVAAKSVKIPTLVIHDTNDDEVPVSCAHAIRQSLEKGEVLITDGLGHRRILTDSKVIENILVFFSK